MLTKHNMKTKRDKQRRRKNKERIVNFVISAKEVLVIGPLFAGNRFGRYEKRLKMSLFQLCPI